ncbi:hypothetical protein Tco_0121539 [Tanacetum coccineum]
MNLMVEYAWKPPLCTHCKVIGHQYRRCVNKELIDEGKIEKAKTRVQSVPKVNESNKASENWQDMRRPSRNRANKVMVWVIIMGIGEVLIEEKMMQNLDGVQVLVDDNIGSRNDKGKSVSKNNDGLKKQAMKHNVIKIKNSFNVLADEIVEEGGEEWL